MQQFNSTLSCIRLSPCLHHHLSQPNLPTTTKSALWHWYTSSIVIASGHAMRKSTASLPPWHSKKIRDDHRNSSQARTTHLLPKSPTTLGKTRYQYLKAIPNTVCYATGQPMPSTTPLTHTNYNTVALDAGQAQLQTPTEPSTSPLELSHPTNTHHASVPPDFTLRGYQLQYPRYHTIALKKINRHCPGSLPIPLLGIIIHIPNFTLAPPASLISFTNPNSGIDIIDKIISSNSCSSTGFHATQPPTPASECVHHLHAKFTIVGAPAYICRRSSNISPENQSGGTISSSKQRHPTHVRISASTPLHHQRWPVNVSTTTMPPTAPWHTYVTDPKRFS